MNGALPPSSRLSRLSVSARLAHQQRADPRRAGEGELAHHRAGRQRRADLDRHAGDDVDHALRECPARSASTISASAVNGVSSDGLITTVQPAASAGAHLARDHRRREVPRRDDRADADRLLEREDAAIDRRRGDVVAGDAAPFLCEPFDEGGGVADLALRLGQRLALLGGHDPREIVLGGEDQRVPRARAGSRDRRRCAPSTREARQPRRRSPPRFRPCRTPEPRRSPRRSPDRAPRSRSPCAGRHSPPISAASTKSASSRSPASRAIRGAPGW